MVYLTDPIGDLLTRIRNAQAVGHKSCTAPFSRLKLELCTLLKKEGWVGDVCVTGEGVHKTLHVVFSEHHPALSLRRVSTPGRRTYVRAREVAPVLRGYGAMILTTNRGLMTAKEARAQKVGGEVLCTVA